MPGVFLFNKQCLFRGECDASLKRSNLPGHRPLAPLLLGQAGRRLWVHFGVNTLGAPVVILTRPSKPIRPTCSIFSERTASRKPRTLPSLLLNTDRLIVLVRSPGINSGFTRQTRFERRSASGSFPYGVSRAHKGLRSRWYPRGLDPGR